MSYRNSVTKMINNDYKLKVEIQQTNKEDKFKLTFLLKEKSTPLWDEFDSQTIISSKLNVIKDTKQLIMDLKKDSYFSKYIERYEYYLKCFDIGNAIYEKNKENRYYV